MNMRIKIISIVQFLNGKDVNKGYVKYTTESENLKLRLSDDKNFK